MRILHRGGFFTSVITIGHRRVFVSCIVEQDCLMKVHCALCSVPGKGFVVCKRAESRCSVWLINFVSSQGCPTIVLIQYEAVSLY